MIARGIEVNWCAWTRLVWESKFWDDPYFRKKLNLKCMVSKGLLSPPLNTKTPHIRLSPLSKNFEYLPP